MSGYTDTDTDTDTHTTLNQFNTYSVGHLVFPAINFKEGDGPFTVDLISWWMAKVAFCLKTNKQKSLTYKAKRQQETKHYYYYCWGPLM